ncbi:uroporphyrinogen-III synthase [Hydrogenophaga sp. PAMC20947]|uniref:uroporphyrinogen-III synthase n=1 Tax=Hydrogenophaga sp. PAMC20947 TaxID=2565558 RepID=UPI001FF9F432|nr:uroporphyrinogen-III synthase [Hydrogenophaga sp. PAMC20947]
MSVVSEMTLPRLQRLMVTRPDADALLWTRSLMDRGWPALALPLIAIGPPRSPEVQRALSRARAQWLTWNALMFVSGAAVKHFFSTEVSAPAPGQLVETRFWAPGPGTARSLAQALASHGVEPARMDSPSADAPQFDSEALWPVVRGQLRPGSRVLVVRGSSDPLEGTAPRLQDTPAQAGQGRDWLMGQCEAAGATVDACVAYERCSPTWSPAELALAAAAAEPGSLWLFSSSEALQHLQQALPNADWSSSSALVTHPRIAQAARSAGFLDVQESRPSLDDVVRALKSHWSSP